MGWQVDTRIRGGHQYSAATIKEYESAIAGLSHACDSLAAVSGNWGRASFTLHHNQSTSWVCPLFFSNDGELVGGEHVRPPYEIIEERCHAHSQTLACMEEELRQLDDLLARASLLYHEADGAAHGIVESLKDATFMLSPGRSMMNVAVSALAGAMQSSLESKRINGIGALRATKNMQEPCCDTFPEPYWDSTWLL